MLGLVVAALLLVACGGGAELELQRAVDRAAESGGTVDLAELADAEWERAAVFGPASSATEIERVLGVPAPARAEAQLADGDRALVLFVRGDRVVAAAEVPHDLAEFAETGEVLSPDAARFAVEREGERTVLVPTS
jgi:hypothetical protein